MAGEWTLPGIGDDLMSSAKFGERRLKVESSLVSGGTGIKKQPFSKCHNKE